jgi:hypothetical protein
MEIDAEARDSRLPEKPDFRAADDFLKLARRESARESLPLGLQAPAGASTPFPRDEHHATLFPVPLPPDVRPEALERFLAHQVWPDPPRTRLPLLWLALSGAHAYGFPSPDSDLDLKGVHRHPARALLGLQDPPKSVDWLGVWEGREYDFSSNDLGQAALLLLKGNGNMFERFLGPYPLATTPAGHRLQALAEEALSKRVFQHYGGFLRAMELEYRTEAAKGLRRAKRLLYAYRVALTGIHVLATGELVTDVRLLFERYGFPEVDALLKAKRERESGTIFETDEPRYLEDIARLARDLEVARSRSPLPEEAPNRRALEEFVIEERLSS